ncbi:MAG TPA: DUF4143 domain-containing protein [Bacteroidales bacterium]|nr:DUF4143 domain-containing protein [Bacteroidales bacterium]HNW68371.1 DUF4143 domain-containing protein [Bacteroidales bacterium]HPT52751.1 DUF4143 domain-containing protein [Bacteroidales bacterium]
MSKLPLQALLGVHTLFTENKGALTEQFVLQQFITKNNVSIYYCLPENSRGKIDLLRQNDMRIILVEVKAEENL